MDTKHNDDILKTRGKNKKGENGQPPATPQPKKQWVSIRIYEDHTPAGRPKNYTLWCDDLEIETALNILTDKVIIKSQMKRYKK